MTEHKPGDFRLMPVGGQVGMFIGAGQWLVGDKWVPYKHAHVYLGNHEFLDAHPGGASVKTYADLDAKDTFWSTDIIPLSDPQRISIRNIALGLQRTPYSFYDYYAIAMHHYHIPIPSLRYYIANTKHMICSQLVDVSYQMADIHLFDDHRWSGYVTPADLYWLLMGIKDGTIPNVN